MSGRWIENASDLVALEEPWNRLCLDRHRPNPMLSFDWMYTWWMVYGEPDPSASLSVWVMESDGGLSAVLPLYRRMTAEGAVYLFLGTGEAEADAVCSDHLSPLVSDEGVIDAMAEALSKLLSDPLDTLILSDMDDDDAVALALREKLARLPMALRTRSGPVCPYLTLPRSRALLRASLSSRFRAHLARNERLFSRMPGNRVEWIDETGDLDGFFEDLVTLHQARWRLSGRPGVFSSDAFSRFHREIIRRFHRRGWLCSAVLRGGGKTLAAYYGFRMGKTAFAYQMGVDTGVPRLAPGLVVHAMVIERAIGEGFSEYDFLRGDDSYKARFTDLTRRMMSVEMARPGLRRALSWGKDSLKDALRPAYRRMVDLAGKCLPKCR